MDSQGKQDQKDEFDEFAQKTQEVLIQVRGVWPFDFFPDEATLNRSMFIVKRNLVPFVSKTITCHHDDILDSHLNLGPFFGSVSVHMKYVTNGVEVINWLSRHDAIKLHAILQGLLAAKKNNLNITALSKRDLTRKLEAIGSVII